VLLRPVSYMRMWKVDQLVIWGCGRSTVSYMMMWMVHQFVIWCGGRWTS